MTRVALLVVIALLATSKPVGAYEPDRDEWEPFPDPVTHEDLTTSEPQEVPEGIYFVTDTYVRDVVATEGPTTTYSTETVHESTGSFARVLDTVLTGAGSRFDGRAFNGRAALNDGRQVAGTFYENFVLTDIGFVSVSIVFFQDDSLTLGSPVPPVTPGPSATTAPSTPTGPTVTPPSEPRLRERDSPPARATATAGVALASDGPTLARAEVLRGQQVALWPRAFVNGDPAPVSAWRLVSASPDRVSATSGASRPLVVQWLRVPTSDEPWTLTFDVSTDNAPDLSLTAAIAIVVRSPALVD